MGASSRVRTMQYFSYFLEYGIAVDCSPFVGDEYLQAQYGGKSYSLWNLAKRYIERLAVLMQARRYDAVWIEKELFPFLPAFAESVLRKSGIPIVVDYDDAVFHNYDMSKSAFIRSVLSTKIDEVMASATVVTTGNTYLADRARAAGARQVEIIPTVVDIERYTTRPSFHQVGMDRGLNVGWIGSPSTAQYLEEVAGAINRSRLNFPIRLIVVGADRKILRGTPMRKLAWTEESEVESIHQFDVGIMPLRDSPWERGKCGYKLIQCMACGIPVIASSVGVNTKIISHGTDGLLANTETEWMAAFKILAGDPSLRCEMGQAARKKVEREFSTQVMAPRLVSIFRSLQ
jgi:glycosyltransferase involved in cell wall biosynthesis